MACELPNYGRFRERSEATRVKGTERGTERGNERDRVRVTAQGGRTRERDSEGERLRLLA